MRSSRTFETNTHVQAYIFQVAANLLKDRSRRQSVRKQAPLSSFREDLIDVILNRIVEARHPERVLIGRQSLAEVYKVLEHLDPRTRNIFILYRLEGMKHREIAALFGIGLSTVEKHCTLAMAELVAQFPDKVL
jgi:RNA polymerase sigma-70 factor (ECF subfamily)